jgi:hypothetical protein
MHGGARKATARKRAERIALAEAAARGRRDPWAVLADVTATADELFKRAREEVGCQIASQPWPSLGDLRCPDCQDAQTL